MSDDLPLDMDVTGQGYYTLDQHRNPVPATSLMKWARWFESRENRIVKQDHIGAYFVSTVFLAMDHGFFSGPPILFETMVFQRMGREEKLEIQERCSTWDEAEAQHAQVVAEIQKATRN